jgi:hypothetical protein
MMMAKSQRVTMPEIAAKTSKKPEFEQNSETLPNLRRSLNFP